MAFKMAGYKSHDHVSAFTKHDGPHPESGVIEYDKERSAEFVTFDDGSKVYGSWNEVPGVSKGGKIPVDKAYPLTTSEMYVSEEKGSQQAVMLDFGAMEENQPQETNEGPTKEQAGPRA